jgi:hypothetical protein
MKSLKSGLALATLLFTQPIFACTIDGQEGFLPKNDMYISVNDKAAAGINESQFNAVIDKIETLYSSIVSQHGGELQIERNWTNGTVNAYAEQVGSTWKVAMFGGLARHRTITEDGFALVVCHELGHHIGGAPKYNSDDWASNEGQSDYFATLKCLRRVWMSENNQEIVRRMEAPQIVKSSCAKSWSDELDQAICVRGALAGESVANLFASMSWGRAPKFDTPDSKVVSRTNDRHPASQCRLDTYFQGALCEKSYSEDVAQDSEVTSTCHGSLGDITGLRPLCWFRPSVL